MKRGKYRHYKGNEYRVLDVVLHTETLEKLVLYHSLEKPEQLWVRPLVMFNENVEVEGRSVPRFTYLGTE